MKRLRDTALKQYYPKYSNSNTRIRSTLLIDKIVIHHSGSEFDDVESIDKLHFNKFNNGGISYHFVIDRNYNIIQTRPLDEVTSHTANNNTKAIGVCCLGDFQNRFPSSKLMFCIELLVDILHKSIARLTVLSHCDLVPTLCPANIKYYVKELNNKLKNHQYAKSNL